MIYIPIAIALGFFAVFAWVVAGHFTVLLWCRFDDTVPDGDYFPIYFFWPLIAAIAAIACAGWLPYRLGIAAVEHLWNRSPKTALPIATARNRKDRQ